jgi:hypothetical protein
LVPPVVGEEGAAVVGEAVVAEVLLFDELPQAARAMAAAAARTIRRFKVWPLLVHGEVFVRLLTVAPHRRVPPPGSLGRATPVTGMALTLKRAGSLGVSRR